ncbi:MAG: hypothetical protein ACFFE8_06075 [Candidatus Heimdallarchaeota archaeon]
MIARISWKQYLRGHFLYRNIGIRMIAFEIQNKETLESLSYGARKVKKNVELFCAATFVEKGLC